MTPGSLVVRRAGTTPSPFPPEPVPARGGCPPSYPDGKPHENLKSNPKIHSQHSQRNTLSPTRSCTRSFHPAAARSTAASKSGGSRKAGVVSSFHHSRTESQRSGSIKRTHSTSSPTSATTDHFEPGSLVPRLLVTDGRLRSSTGLDPEPPDEGPPARSMPSRSDPGFSNFAPISCAPDRKLWKASCKRWSET